MADTTSSFGRPGDKPKAAQSAATSAGKSPAAKAEQSDATSIEILAAIEKHQAARKGAEARKQPRQFVCIAAVLEIQDSPGGPVRFASVATNNFSEGGFGFILDAHLRPGTMVRTRFETLQGKPTISGVVRSSVRICGTQHRIGVEFNQ